MTNDRTTHLSLVNGDAVHAPGQPVPFRTSWTADELMAMTFPEPRWAVPGIIAEGLSLLAGPPKVGKSWLSLGLGIAVASGSKALEAIELEPGPVLYLALEDTARRLQNRMGKILSGQPAPKDLTLATTCPTLPQGGDEAIARWLDREGHRGRHRPVLRERPQDLPAHERRRPALRERHRPLPPTRDTTRWRPQRPNRP
ncbi:AAA domain-containing protein [Nonomuraea maritima]|uniref:AAA domain-containing protein n=1 Tax=Nonomuraea maritima TaxID=683260 RepID=A0A1G9SXS0_9ACTN|nr:AAA family ATPase [Nonomuraea maritima]SDM39655.1 AAA domain-containing protein [Nonomuraea maritima]